MSLDPDDQDQGELPQLELKRPQSKRQPGDHPGLDGRRQSVSTGEPLGQERPGGRRVREAPRVHEDSRGELNPETGDEPRRSLLRRHPLAFMLGLFLLTLALAAGYFFWDYSRHFQSTDDAFVAARQFSIAPKVSGYITAVPVTDNQHVAAGNVITRIDDHDYRIALDQAQAQVAVAQANIQNIDA